MQHSKPLLSWLLLFAAATISARSIPTINADRASEAAREQVMWHGSLCTLSTMAQDFLQNVYGKSTYQGLSPVQVVYGWALRPDAWKEEPMILIPDEDLRRQLAIEGEYAKFSQLFDDTLGYRLNQIGTNLPAHMQKLVRESASVVELDEKVGLIILLTQGRLIQPRPDSIPPMGKLRIEAEIFYNEQPYILLLLLTLSVAIIIFALFSPKKHETGR